MRKAVEILFSKYRKKIFFNARKEAGLITKNENGGPNYETKKNRKVKKYFELDVWIPELNIGFEYQVYVFMLCVCVCVFPPFYT